MQDVLQRISILATYSKKKRWKHVLVEAAQGKKPRLHLVWGNEFPLREVESGPPRMNERTLGINRILGMNLHWVELLDVKGSTAKIGFRASTKGIYESSFTRAACKGTSVAVGDGYMHIVDIQHYEDPPTATIEFRRTP